MSTLYEYVQRTGIPKVHLYIDLDNQPGMWTDANKKRAFLRATRSFFDYGSVYTLREWVASEPEVKRKELHDQLLRMRPIMLEGKSVNSRDTWTFSGKMGHDGRKSTSMQDDMAITLLMCFYMIECVLWGDTGIPASISGETVRVASDATVKLKRQREGRA